MKDFWNERYATDSYAYGKEPNTFLKESLDKLDSGLILLPAEGEGRNAVHAALQGWEVTAFDISQEGQEKAFKLAEEKGVKINYEVLGFEEFMRPANTFDAIALIYTHLPRQKRKEYFQKCLKMLKPKGTLILEGFSEKQLGLSSGGPKDISMLFSLEQIRQELEGIEISLGKELEIQLNEGHYHVGKGEVVQILGVKK